MCKQQERIAPHGEWTIGTTSSKICGMLRTLILQYHKVTNRFEVGGTRVTVKQFRNHVAQVRSLGYKQLDIEALKSGSPIDEPSVLFTFDDGFECIYFNAFPILEEADYVGIVFPVARYIGKANDWDASFGIRFRQMDAHQLRELVGAGWWVGSHTMTHPDLRKLDDKRLRNELEGSRKLLEDLIGKSVTSIAYPFGTYNRRVVEFAIKYGYQIGFTSRRTLKLQLDDPMQIERQGVYLIDLSLKPKIDTSSPIFIAESVKQIAINQFARLSSLARHDIPIIRHISGMKVE